MIEHVREDRWHFSHVVRARGLLLLSGVTGTAEDGTVDPEPRPQFEQAFQHLGLYLEAAGATVDPFALDDLQRAPPRRGALRAGGVV